MNNDLPPRDVAGYIAAARAAPAAITYASPGNGTSMHLTGVMFEQAAGVELTHVPYRGSAQALSDLISGQVASSFGDVLVVMLQIRAGAIRALGITSPLRHPLMLDIPTMREAGLAEFEAASWQGLFAPAGTPGPVVSRLYAEVSRAMMAIEIRDSFSRQGFMVEATPPDEFAAFVAAETARWAAVVRAGKVRLD